MTARLRTLFARTDFRLCLVLWTFGYALVEISAAMLGRTNSLLMPLGSLPLLIVGVTLSLLLASQLNRIADSHSLMKWPFLLVAVAAAGAVQSAADLFWQRALALTVFPSWREWALSTSQARLFNIYLLYTWTLALSLALVSSARTSGIAKVSEARADAFEAAPLRLQLNPHFLFNTLNGIASLVVCGKAVQAEEMIGRLAHFLRSSLAADPTALIPLRSELATVRAYLHVEQARFGDRMVLAFDVPDEALDIPVPNFVLQPLIENAVRYGVAASPQGTSIAVEARVRDASLVIAVVNLETGGEIAIRRGDTKAAVAHGSGIGLANTRKRLQSLYGNEAWVEARDLGRGFRCEIGMPLPPSRPMGTVAP